MIYDSMIHQKEMKQVKQDTIRISGITKMIQNQVKLFSTVGSHFDYRSLFEKGDGLLLHEYLYQQNSTKNEAISVVMSILC